VVDGTQAELGIPPSTLSHRLEKLKNEDLGAGSRAVLVLGPARCAG
jgi:hypothetical protein